MRQDERETGQALAESGRTQNRKGKRQNQERGRTAVYRTGGRQDRS